MTRSLKQIAADMRSMADMLITAAQELEKSPEINQEMIHAIQVLAPLLKKPEGGDTVAAAHPMIPNPTSNFKPGTLVKR